MNVWIIALKFGKPEETLEINFFKFQSWNATGNIRDNVVDVEIY